MKKLFVFLMLAVMVGALAAGIATELKRAATWADFRAVQAEIKQLEGAGDYAGAADTYLRYETIAGNLDRPDLVAWGLNNRAYNFILAYKKDPLNPAAKIWLTLAKMALDQATGYIDYATADARRCIASNKSFITAITKAAK